MAEGILRDLLERKGLDAVTTVRSAGTWGGPGNAASENAVKAVAELGIDIEHHRSTRITRALIEGADLILTMEPGHLEEIVFAVPEAAAKTHVISVYADPGAGSPHGVDDPIGGDPAAYERTCREIVDLLEKALPRIVDEVQAAEGPVADGSGTSRRGS
jgi:protein-tyrosine-phosphatase